MPIVTNPSKGFTGWLHQTFQFVTDAQTDTISFTDIGAPGAPPFALLDGVAFIQAGPGFAAKLCRTRPPGR